MKYQNTKFKETKNGLYAREFVSDFEGAARGYLEGEKKNRNDSQGEINIS